MLSLSSMNLLLGKRIDMCAPIKLQLNPNGLKNILPFDLRVTLLDTTLLLLFKQIYETRQWDYD